MNFYSMKRRLTVIQTTARRIYVSALVCSSVNFMVNRQICPYFTVEHKIDGATYQSRDVDSTRRRLNDGPVESTRDIKPSVHHVF